MNFDDPWPEVAVELKLSMEDLKAMIAEVNKIDELNSDLAPRCRDRLGRPITYGQWTALFASHEYRLVKRTELRDDTHVSTIWLGFNHGYGAEGELFYETMVFGGDDRVEDLCHRYPTEEMALADHDQVVAYLKEELQNLER